MLDLAAITLFVLSGLLSAAAIAAFPWSVATARVLLPCAIAVATLGLLVVGLAGLSKSASRYGHSCSPAVPAAVMGMGPETCLPGRHAGSTGLSFTPVTERRSPGWGSLLFACNPRLCPAG